MKIIFECPHCGKNAAHFFDPFGNLCILNTNKKCIQCDKSISLNGIAFCLYYFLVPLILFVGPLITIHNLFAEQMASDWVYVLTLLSLFIWIILFNIFVLPLFGVRMFKP